MKQKESELKTSILKWLRCQNDTFVFNVHTTGIPVGRTGKFRINFNKGIADIIGVKKGRFFAFEVKTEDGKLNDNQRKWLEKVDSAGGYSCVVRSCTDAIDAFNEI